MYDKQKANYISSHTDDLELELSGVHGEQWMRRSDSSSSLRWCSESYVLCVSKQD